MSFSFLNIFSHKSAASSRASKDTLTNPAKIGGLLQHLLDDRNLLSIKLPNVEHTFTSAILEVEKTHKTFTLDEISPDEGHQLFLSKKTLQVSGQSRGALFSFTVPLKRQDSSRGIAFYEFDFPATVSYLQRRASYRARLRDEQHISVTTLHNESSTSISGYVTDISNHGISILFNTERHIKRGDRLTLCKLRLPDGQQIIFDLDVRHAQSLPNERLRVGGRFLDLNRRSSQIVSKFVRKLERAALRK